MTWAGMMAVACLIDAFFGWPDALFRRIGHPVTWIGAAIAGIEPRLNTGSDASRFFKGALCVAIIVIATALPAVVLHYTLPNSVIGVVLGGAMAWPFVALRSMHDHVAAVARPLASGQLDEARQAVSMIVGRDPAQLDDSGVARASLESLAENTSDGIVAPVFWGCVAGLPGIAVYKAINTMDSMIAHRNARYEFFGKIAARLDDLVNLIPARLTGALFALAAGLRLRPAFSVMMRDAGAHRSPNAGWPEGAMAGALDVRLSGPRVYEDRVSNEPWLNGSAPDPVSTDVLRGLSLYRRSMVLLVLALAALALF